MSETPIELRLDPDHGRTIQIFFEGEWIIVAAVHGPSWSYPDGGKNARYRAMSAPIARRIVQAVNSYDGLVAACKAALSELDAFINARHQEGRCVPQADCELRERLGAAIAKAEETP